MTAIHIRPSDISPDNWRLLRATAKAAHKSVAQGHAPTQREQHAIDVLEACKLTKESL